MQVVIHLPLHERKMINRHIVSMCIRLVRRRAEVTLWEEIRADLFRRSAADKNQMRIRAGLNMSRTTLYRFGQEDFEKRPAREAVDFVGGCNPVPREDADI